MLNFDECLISPLSSPILLDIFSKKKHTMSAESVQPETLAALVEFVYNSEAQLSPESLIKLRDATSKLGIKWLELYILPKWRNESRRE